MELQHIDYPNELKQVFKCINHFKTIVDLGRKEDLLSVLKSLMAKFHALLNAKKKADLPAFQNRMTEIVSFLKHHKLNHNSTNIFTLCNVGHDELKNCAILAWLLDEKASHGIGNTFLKNILDFAASANEKAISSDLLENYITRTEYCPNSDEENRVDIVCESGNFLLYIEVKIDSAEHGSQTKRYYDKLRQNCHNRSHAILFLSRNAKPENENALWITWEQIGHILNNISATLPDSFNAQLIRQYADHVASF